MELTELFTSQELADMIAQNMGIRYVIKHDQISTSAGTTIVTMCDPQYPHPPICLIIINNNRISIAKNDIENNGQTQTELIRITKDDVCTNGFFVSNCTRSKADTILNLIDKIKKAIDNKVKNRTETNVGKITITDDDIINIICSSVCIDNFTTFEIPCGNYKEIFIEDTDWALSDVRYGFSRVDNIVQIIRRTTTLNSNGGPAENTAILVRLDTDNGNIEKLINNPIAISVVARLEEFIEKGKNKEETKEEIKEEKNMPKIEVDSAEIPKYVLKDIREAVKEWIVDEAGGDLPIKNGSGDSKEYWWLNAVDKGYIDIGLIQCDHGFVIVSRSCYDRTNHTNLFTITQMGNNEPNIRYVGIGPMTQPVANLKTALEEKYASIKIEWRKTTKKKKTKKTTESEGLEKYGLTDNKKFSPYDIKSIKFNTTKKVTTVIFKDGTRIMTKATASDPFDPEVGLAMCIMKKLYGTRSNYKRVVTTAMKNTEKANKRIKKRADKKLAKQQAAADHIKAQAESYME